MRSANPTIGSVTDRIHAVAIAVKGLRDLAEAEYRFPALMAQLDHVARRCQVVRIRGGAVPGLAEAVDWLEASVRESAALAGPDGEPFRSELLRLASRCRD